MRIFLVLGFLVSFLFSEKLIIDAKNFEAYDEKGLSIFTGDVKMVKSSDELESDRLEVYLSEKKPNTKREPLKYIATGNVKFKVKTAGKSYEGKGDKVVYEPKKLKYVITGNGFLKEVTEDKRLFGDKIVINQITGEAKVTGSENKPVRFIIDLGDTSNKKKESKQVTPTVEKTNKVEAK
ncbi:lipopolysaccharide transport periplasmic protein LptA [Arcobacter sp. KX21116]|jgi:lipopolysaccharide export system protein LptA|uniref:lipopolysaccharide transport periplasmic protein LptA n=1 Tax=Arcobacter iocasae TaxID=2906515 RepID=UPI0035D428B5|tara:strand:+ start:51589 stop:52128 length:540 start_codon:yes stop_codon:yes gene_type:complete